MHLLPKLFSKMCFMVYAWTYDGDMAFEYLARINLKILCFKI